MGSFCSVGEDSVGGGLSSEQMGDCLHDKVEVHLFSDLVLLLVKLSIAGDFHHVKMDLVHCEQGPVCQTKLS